MKRTIEMCNSEERGFQRQQLDKQSIPVIHIDEKSYKKAHQYITVTSESKGGRVLELVKERRESSTEEL
jgi:hypothetical protein